MNISKILRAPVVECILRQIPDKQYIKLMYRKNFGKWPNLDNPVTYSEKLQWLKLYDRRPEYTVMVDKYAVKKYVADVIGEEFVIPTLGVWDNPEDIDFDLLPQKFVLKWNHDSGSIVICKDKKSFDCDMAIRKLRRGAKVNGFWYGREWPYKNVRPVILAEQYIEPRNGTNDLPDYKFFCFNGKVKGLFVATERQNPNEEVKFDFFDADFTPLPIRQGHDHAKILPSKPLYFDIMKDAASKLSLGIPQIRVDFYETDDKVYFGELTLFHFSGMVPFEPEECDNRFGEMISLPERR